MSAAGDDELPHLDGDTEPANIEQDVSEVTANKEADVQDLSTLFDTDGRIVITRDIELVNEVEQFVKRLNNKGYYKR